MSKIIQVIKRVAFGSIAVLLIGGLAGCGIAPVEDKEGRVYHCVGTARPVPPPNTFSKKLPLERFEYGQYQDIDRPTIGTDRYCNFLHLPPTAYLRYQVDGRVIEKRLDLSALTVRRVYKKTVEFYVDGEAVEVRLVTPVPGNWPIKEVIVRQ